MKKIQWGIIYSKDASEEKHLQEFGMVDYSTVVAVTDGDAQELINNENVNAVYIATPPSSHAAYAIMAMKAGKPVLVNAPLAATYEDCARIIRVSQQTGIPCFTAYYQRYLPYFEKVKQIVDSGVLGVPLSVSVRMAMPYDNGNEHLEQLITPQTILNNNCNGGHFHRYASHQFDMLQYLFGVITDAKGYAENRLCLYDDEDSVTTCFRFEDGLVGSGSWCFACDDSAVADRIDINGDKGSVYFSAFNYKPIHLNTPNGIEEFDFPLPEHVQLPCIEAVIKHLQGERIYDCDCVSATLTNWVLDKVMRKL